MSHLACGLRGGGLIVGVFMAMIGAPTGAMAQLELRPLFGDGMVIQRDAAVPVRGTATPGAEVVVRLGASERTARAGPDGRWAVHLPPRSAGGPYELEVRAGTERIEVRNVLVGDVWIASGQSNMEWTVADSRDAAREIASADDGAIRQFRVPRSWSYDPATELVGGQWEVSDSAHVGAHSAVAYFFARSIRAHVDVPIGIIDNSWGGARIEPYMSGRSVGLDDGGLRKLVEDQRARDEALRDSLKSRIGALPDADLGTVNGEPIWADPALDDGDWSVIPVPGLWEAAGYAGLDGVAWYRHAFELTAAEAASPVALGLGMIDDSDITWVNGREVGRTEQAWSQVRGYAVPAGVLHAGVNTVVVRVEDTGGGGGIHGDPASLYVETAAGRRPLAGDWRFRVGRVSMDGDGGKNQVPTLLYNRMVHPLTDVPIRGVLWYQGESNADGTDAVAYRDQFMAMIRDWRAAWGQADLPFLWVQLANYMAPAEAPVPSDWAVLRESQGAALALPNTAQVVAIDLGEADDIHPRNKQDVGQRLARAARAIAYGEEMVYSGPTYRSHRVRDGRVEIDFDHMGGGLVARDGPELRGFAVAGADGRFVWADARIEAGRVVVWSPRVSEPVAVRYAWADNPEGANLYNADGLPAAPFRTDRPGQSER